MRICSITRQLNKIETFREHKWMLLIFFLTIHFFKGFQFKWLTFGEQVKHKFHKKFHNNKFMFVQFCDLILKMVCTFSAYFFMSFVQCALYIVSNLVCNKTGLLILLTSQRYLLSSYIRNSLCICVELDRHAVTGNW